MIRRDFLTGISAVGALTCFSPLAAKAAPEKAKDGNARFQLGLASYTTRNFDQAATIAMCKRVGLPCMCLKDFHLKLDASDAECAAAAKACKKEGITLYGAGVITMKTPESVENAFRYAKAAGITTIVGVPYPEIYELLDKKVKETGIYVAIHNHGPGDKMYPTPQSIYEKISHLDPKIGLCIDVGHTVRIGADVIESIHKYKDRLFDLHIKDEDKAEPSGQTCVCGHGVIDLPAVIAAIKAIEYDRVVSFEYEENAKDPLPGLAESVGYIRGLIRMT